MLDAFAFCAELVRNNDRDAFVASLFAPAESRGALHALYAFNIEVTRVRDVAHAALPGEIRLQWWTDVLAGERAGEAHANPVAAALLAAIERHDLPVAVLLELIEARRFDLYDDPMASVSDLKAYARSTSSGLFGLAARVLTSTTIESVAEHAGIASTIAGLLIAFPRHAARGQLYVPADILERHGVPLHDVFGGRSSAGLSAALAELRKVGRDGLAAIREPIAAMVRAAIPAVLPLAVTGPLLDRLDRSEPFAPKQLSPLRRQWLIWRASRNPQRITR